MKVVLLVPMASPDRAYPAGDVWDVSEEEGSRMIAAGVASAVPAKVPEVPESKIKARREKR